LKIIFERTFLYLFLFFLAQNLTARPSSNFRVLKETSSSILLEWHSPEIQWDIVDINGKQYALPQCGDLPLLQIEGFPQLPIDNFVINNAADVSITVLDSVWTAEKSGILCPSPSWKFNVKDSSLKAIYEPHPRIYSSTNSYPASFITFQTAQQGKKQFARLGVFPLKYSTPNQVLVLRYLKVEIIKNRKDQSMPLKKSATQSIDFENALKLYSKEEGVHSVSGSDISSSGFRLLDISPNTIKLYHKGQQQACVVNDGGDGVFDENDKVYYFAERLAGDSTYFNAFSDTNVYWLTWGGANGLRFTNAEAETFGGPIVKSLPHTIHLEQDKEYYYGDRDADIHETLDVPGEGWVWNKNMFPNSSFRTTFETPGLVAENNVNVHVHFRGSTLSATNPDHHAQISINGQTVGDFYFNDTGDVFETLSIPADLFVESDNAVEALSVPIPGVDLSKFYIDWFEIDYSRKLVAFDDFIRMRNIENRANGFTVSGFSSDSISIWDVANGAALIPQNVDKRKEINIKVRSAGINDGNYAQIDVDGKRTFTGKRGINLVTFDAQTGNLLETKSFDTYLTNDQSDSLALFVDGLSDSTIVVAAVRDDASANLNDIAKEALTTIGSSMIGDLGYRDSWAIIGKKGALSGSVPESLKKSGQGGISLDMDFIFRDGNNTYTIDFSGTVSDIVVFEKSAVKKPIGIRAPSPTLYPDAVGADYIVITHPDFKSAAQTLADYRTSENGFRTFITTPEEIYDHYSFGIVEPNAIKQFLQEAFNTWSFPAPQYVVLLGDATWDPKHNLPNAVKIDYVPTLGNPVSDALFVCFDGPDDIVPDMNIGRLPVETLQQAQDIVEKIISYEQSLSAVWKKKFLFINGGFNHIEQSTFKQQSQLLIKDFIAPPPTSGIVQLINKESQGYEEGEKREDILDAFKKGALWVNFIGHAGSRTWDLMFHNPDVEDLTNAPALPIITSMTCHTGRFAEPNQNSFGEKFLLSPENGAIGFWGTSGWGYTYEDYMYLRRLFPIVFQDTVHTVGQAITQAKVAMWNSFGPIPHIRDLILQYNFLGDPALKLALPEQPDLVLAPSNISTIPFVPNEADSTALVKVVAENYGLATSDSVEILLTVNHSKSSSRTLGANEKFPPIGFRDSLFIVWPLENMAGIAQLDATLDPKDLIPEADETNNNQLLEVNVLSNLISIFSPQRDAQIPFNEVVLKIQNPQGPEFQNNSVEFQIDTTDLFNSESLKSSGVFAPGFVFTSWDPGELVPNQLYFWRVRTVDNSDSDLWNTSWFYSSDKEHGWAQTADRQFAANLGNNIAAKNNSVTLLNQQTNFYVESAGFSDGNFARIIINGVALVSPKRGINCAVYDGILATVDTVVTFDTYQDETASERLAAFLENVADNKIVMAAIKDEGSRLLSDRAKQALQQIGSSKSFQIGSRDSWAIIGQKGADIGSVPESFVKSGNGPAVVTDSLTTFAPNGSISTLPIGPTSQWQDLSWSARVPDFTELNIAVAGHNTESGNLDTLLQVSGEQNKIDLSFISAPTYPLLSLFTNLSSQRGDLTPQLENWSITHAPVPDLAITPETYSQNKDSVLVGESINLLLNVYNIGLVNVDSVSINFYESDVSTGRIKFASQHIRHSLPPDSFYTVTQEYLSINKKGLKKIFITVDPENKIPELEENNNSLSSLIYVRADSAQPEIEITFDGLQVGYGELVSATPKIIAKILDNSAVPITDTSQVNVFLDGRPVYFNGNEILRLQSGNSLQNGIVELYPVFEDGDHLLEIYATDASDNKVYQRVAFTVFSELQLRQVLNYPNPMQDNTSFTFTLTQPADIKIKVFTVAGRLIRHINAGYSLAGYNVIEWDGRDGDGDRLANGVYLYNAVADNGQKSVMVSNKIIIMR
jgi:hypothetical protein